MSGSKVAIHITYHTEKFSMTLFFTPKFILPGKYVKYPCILFSSIFYSQVSMRDEICEPEDWKWIGKLFFFFANCQLHLIFLRILSKVTHENANIRNSSWMVCFCRAYYSFSSKTQPSEPMPSGKSLNDTFKELLGKHSRLEYLNYWSAWLMKVSHFSQSPMCVWQLNWALYLFHSTVTHLIYISYQLTVYWAPW